MPKKIVIAVTGASGSVYAKMLIDKLLSIKEEKIGISLIFSDNGEKVWDFELGRINLKSTDLKIFKNDDFFAPCASGSSDYEGMVIIPCTMGTLGRIASGTSDDLISRSADVMLKERKKLILVTRETPLNLIHIENMRKVTLAGGIIFPASPSFYSKPESIDELLFTVVNRVIDLLQIKTNHFRWGEQL